MALGDSDILKKGGAWNTKWALRALGGSFLVGLIYSFMYFGTRAGVSLDLLPSAIGPAFGAALGFFLTAQLMLKVQGGYVYTSQVLGFYATGLFMYYALGSFLPRIKEIHEESAKRFKELHALSILYYVLGFSLGTYFGGLLVAAMFSALGAAGEDALYGMVPSPGIYPGGGTVDPGFAFLAELILSTILGLVLGFFYLKDKMDMVPLYGAGSVLALTFVGFNLSGAPFDIGLWLFGSLARCTIDGNECFESPDGNAAVWWWEYLGSIAGFMIGLMLAYFAVWPKELYTKFGEQGQEMSAPLVGAAMHDADNTLNQRQVKGRVDESALGESMF